MAYLAHSAHLGPNMTDCPTPSPRTRRSTYCRWQPSLADNFRIVFVVISCFKFYLEISSILIAFAFGITANNSALIRRNGHFYPRKFACDHLRPFSGHQFSIRVREVWRQYDEVEFHSRVLFKNLGNPSGLFYHLIFLPFHVTFRLNQNQIIYIVVCESHEHINILLRSCNYLIPVCIMVHERHSGSGAGICQCKAGMQPVQIIFHCDEGIRRHFEMRELNKESAESP